MLLSDWRQRDATFDNTLKVERNVMFVIVMLIVLVATLNIISGLDHAREEQSARYRRFAYHGGHTRGDHARVLHQRHRASVSSAHF